MYIKLIKQQHKQQLPMTISISFLTVYIAVGAYIFNNLEIAQTRLERIINNSATIREETINTEYITNLLNLNQQKESFDIPITKNTDR